MGKYSWESRDYKETEDTTIEQALVGLYTDREHSLMILIITSVPMIFEPGFVWPKESLPFLIKFVGFLSQQLQPVLDLLE